MGYDRETINLLNSIQRDVKRRGYSFDFNEKIEIKQQKQKNTHNRFLVPAKKHFNFVPIVIDARLSYNDELTSHCKILSPIVKLIKRVIKKALCFILKPLIDTQNLINSQIINENNKLKEQVCDMQNELEYIKLELLHARKDETE